MSEAPSATMRVQIEAASADVAALGGYQPFAVARAITPGGRDNEALFVVRGTFSQGTEASVPVADCLALPKDVDPTRAILALPLASALSLWESVGLELGEVAVWTAGSPLSTLVGQAAIWRGACPGIELGPTTAASKTIACDHVDWSDAEVAQRMLTDLTAGRPGMVAVDLSGRADVIDIFLEVMPVFGRLVLAGPPGDRVTIDFYKNIHRKGAIIRSTVLEPAAAFEPDAGASIRAEIERALEVLRHPVMAEQCRALIGSAATAVVAVALLTSTSDASR